MHGSDVYMRINQQKGANAFSNSNRTDTSFYAIDLANGDVCWFIGDSPNEYFILETSLTCSKVLITD